MVTLLYEVLDFDAYLTYGVKARTIVTKHKGRFLVSSHQNYAITSVEGQNPDVVNISIFPDKEQYFGFYNSLEYQDLIKEREAVCKSQVLILEKENKNETK